jgi:hypothetical protein
VRTAPLATALTAAAGAPGTSADASLDMLPVAGGMTLGGCGQDCMRCGELRADCTCDQALLP